MIITAKHMKIITNKIICYLFWHNYKYLRRENGIFWGWNIFICTRCKKQTDSFN